MILSFSSIFERVAICDKAAHLAILSTGCSSKHHSQSEPGERELDGRDYGEPEAVRQARKRGMEFVALAAAGMALV